MSDNNPRDLTTYSAPPSPTPTQPLLPASQPPPNFPAPSRSLIPFTSLLVPITAILGLFSWIAVKTTANPSSDVEHGASEAGAVNHAGGNCLRTTEFNVQRKFTIGMKYYPLVAGESQLNLPLVILRRLSEWVALLETRGNTGGRFVISLFVSHAVGIDVIAGAAIGGMLGCIASFEDQLTGLEKILTTPLPL
jgi:hypothetical protein